MVTFFIEGLKHLYQVGTVFPSSPWFARAMTQSVRRDRSPKRILEIGPGTGGMTRLLLSSLNDGDEFHIVERNPVFCSAHYNGPRMRCALACLLRPEFKVSFGGESVGPDVCPECGRHLILRLSFDEPREVGRLPSTRVGTPVAEPPVR